MKNFIRRLLGRFYAVNHSDVLTYKGSWRTGLFHGYGVLEYKFGGVNEGNFKLGANTALVFSIQLLVFNMLEIGPMETKQDQPKYFIKMVTGIRGW